MSADPRVVRTRAVLRQALMELLRQNDWDRITVASICRHAGVARSSFYEHLTSKAELLDEIFVDLTSNILPSAQPDAPLATLDWLVDHVAEVPEFFVHAMEGGRGGALLPRFRTALIRKLTEELTARSISHAAGKAAYVIGGSMACLAQKKDAASRADLQEMAARMLI
ncbi:MAG: helix-turn-helix transcriptional regulator [Rhodobiaceae bacterium]|nr:helix-turn-helix transcriptional regulator [Rhodobiaceae bacterium]